MPNHWHLLLWPRADGELSEVMRWITVTHTQRWHAHRRSSGTGPVYQGRFESFPVQTDKHFITVAFDFLTHWPMERPQNWIEVVNAPDNASQLDDLRTSAQRGRPFGSADWITVMAKQLGLDSTMQARGRPKRT